MRAEEGRKERLKEAQKRPTRGLKEVIGWIVEVDPPLMVDSVTSVGNGVVDRVSPFLVSIVVSIVCSQYVLHSVYYMYDKRVEYILY